MKKQMMLDQAKALSERLAIAISSTVKGKFAFAGSLRRQEQEIGDIDLLYEGDVDELRIVKGFKKLSGGLERATFEWESVQVDVWRVAPDTWGSMLFAVTGPTKYFIWYAKKAATKGMKLSGKGLIDSKGIVVASKKEEDIFHALDKEWKEPKLRGK